MKNYLLIIVICCAGCLAKNADKRVNKEKVNAEVEKTLNEYFAAIKNEGLMSEFRYLDSSEDFFWVPPGHIIRLNYKETRKIIEASIPLMKHMDNQWKALEIHPLTNEIATYTGIVNSTYTDTTNTQRKIQLVETGTVIKRSNGWKLLCGQTALTSDEY